MCNISEPIPPWAVLSKWNVYFWNSKLFIMQTCWLAVFAPPWQIPFWWEKCQWENHGAYWGLWALIHMQRRVAQITVGSSLHREEWLRHKGLESIHPSPSSRSQTQNEFPNMGLSPCDNMWHCEKLKPLSLPAEGLFDVVYMKWSPLVHGMA